MWQQRAAAAVRRRVRVFRTKRKEEEGQCGNKAAAAGVSDQVEPAHSGRVPEPIEPSGGRRGAEAGQRVLLQPRAACPREARAPFIGGGGAASQDGSARKDSATPPGGTQSDDGCPPG